MPIFEYAAKKPGEKKEEHSEIIANTSEEARHKLVKMGLIPGAIKLKGKKSRVGNFRNKVKVKDKILFSRQLSTLISAGMPVVKSLHIVEDQTQSEAMKRYIARLANDVEGGKSLSNSMKDIPEVFSNVYVNLVSAGEASGTLDETLVRLANQQEKDAQITAKVKGALVYPAIVLLVITGVVIFLLTSVLPQVVTMYDGLDKDLPVITSLLLSLSDFIMSYWWLVVVMIVIAVMSLRAYIKTDAGRRAWDSFKMKVPIFGKLMNKLYMARFARTAQTLMASSVPLLKTLDITGEAVNNVIVRQSVIEASEEVKGGINLSDALAKQTNTFLPLVPQMIAIGEKSGDIDNMVGKAADYYEEELDNEVATISTTIEPILMVVLAVVAGGMVAAILLPVYALIGESIG